MFQMTGRAAAVLALLGLVALASTSHFDGGRSAWSPAGYALVAAAGLVVLGALLVGAWVVGHAAFAGTTVRGKVLVVTGVAAAVVAGIVLLVVVPRLSTENPWIPAYGKRCLDGGFVWLHYPNRRAELFSHPERFCWPSGGRGGTMSGRGGAPTEISGTLLAVAGSAVVVLLAGAALLAVGARRARRHERSGVDDEDAIVIRALDESLDDLRRERDVRRAIVACYARMERVLASVGRERRAHETPLEFLRRVLERVAREPGQVLTELFERARFSVEPMGEREKRDAIAALEALRARAAG